MNYKDFIERCDKQICLRKTITSKNCTKEYKRKRCYEKFLKLREKNYEKIKNSFILQSEKTIKVDDEYLKFREQVWIDDCGFHDHIYKRKNWKECCKLWQYISKEEKEFLEINYKEELDIFGRYLDVAHIKPKGSHPELKYDPKNGVIVCRYFHRLLDDLKDPITRESISNEERLDWFKKIKK